MLPLFRHFLLLVLLPLAAAAATPAARPNILFVIYDDWGWRDAGTFRAKQRFHRISGCEGNAAAMAQTWGSRRRRQSRACCLGQAWNGGFLGGRWADERHRMARAETGREPTGFRFRRPARQAGNGGGDIARLIAVIAKAETGQKPGQIGKAKA